MRTRFLLLCLLFVIALIQVLPQVDLPDTAFHEDTAPTVTKFRIFDAPAVSVLTIVSQLHCEFQQFPRVCSRTSIHSVNEPLPILLSALLC